MTDFSRVCDMCGDRVGFKAESVTRSDGGLDHASCHSPEMELVWRIFGPPVAQRGRVASEQMARQLGHVITRERRRELTDSGHRAVSLISCACGWRSPWLPDRESGREREKHLRDAAIRG